MRCSPCNSLALKSENGIPSSSCALLAIWFVAGSSAYAHGDIHDRIMALDERIMTDSRDPQLYLQRAQLYGEHEEWSRAFKDYDTAKSLDPQLDTRLLRGQALLASGHHKGALVLLNNFLKQHPDHSRALVCRARVLAKLDRRSDSLVDYRQALRHTAMPEPDLVLEAAEAFAALGFRSEALQVLDAGNGKLGCLPALVIRAIELEVVTRDFNAALARVEVMRQVAPRPEPWMARRASVLAQAGRNAESISAWHALSQHLAALPDADRGSHAMNLLKEQAQQAIASLGNLSGDAQSPSTP
jgi:tetratricopeptide (TPR) repeat protein